MHSVRMTRDAKKRRTPEQIRARSLLIGLILFLIAAGFFVSAIIKQMYFTPH
jgi:hypothetical protein